MTSILASIYLLAVSHSHAVLPTAPSNPTAVAVSSTQINLSWQDNSNNETGFRVQRLTGDSYITIANTGANVTSYADTNLTPSTTYYYHIRAYNGSGNSEPTPMIYAMTQAKYPTPTPTPVKSRPAGIMLLMSAKLDGTSGIGNHPALANANVDGMRVKINWSTVEPTEGSYNWVSIDTAISLARSLNKKISISVNAGSGTDIPNWVYAAGAQKYTLTTGNFAGEGVPPPDDPVFLAKWKTFISDYGARYDANPTINYIVMTGFGYTVEWYMGSGADAAYFQSLSPPNPPGTAKWIAGAKEIIDAFMAAFLSTPSFGALGNVYFNNNGDTAEQTVVDWAAAKYPGRFGIMNNTLQVNSNTNFYPNLAVNTYRSSQPTGFQLLWSQIQNVGNDGAKLCDCTGDPNALDESLTAGVNIGGRFAEVYEVDCNNSALQGTITFHQAQFKAQP